jgi:hypothetical protein
MYFIIPTAVIVVEGLHACLWAPWGMNICSFVLGVDAGLVHCPHLATALYTQTELPLRVDQAYKLSHNFNHKAISALCPSVHSLLYSLNSTISCHIIQYYA